MLLPLLVATAWAGAWSSFGAPPAGHQLLSEAVGPDLVRFEYESPGVGHYWIDITPDRGGSSLCGGAGFAVQLRKSLTEADDFVLDGLPAPAQAVCDGLTRAAPSLHLAMAVAVPADRTPDPDVKTDDAPVEAPATPELAIALPRVGQAVVLAALLAALATVPRWPRDRRLGIAAALTLGAGALRLSAAPITVILGGDAAYERLISALGRGAPDRYYGETWLSLQGLVSATLRALGVAPARPTDFVHGSNFVASALAPALLYGLALRLGLPARVAVAVGAALAVWPQAVTLARIEDHAVLASTLQLAVALAVLGTSRAERAAAVFGAALLGHLRPDQGPTAALLLLPLAARRDWLAFGLGGALLATRLGYLPGAAHSPIDYGRLLSFRDWPPMVQAFWGPAGPLAPALLASGGLGLVLGMAPRATSVPRAKLAWAALLLVAVTLPYLPKDLPAADPLRFSLPALPWLLVLAAAGAVAVVGVARRDRRVGAALAVAVAATALVPRGADRHPRPWVWEEEYRFLRDALPVPEGDALTAQPVDHVGWYDDGQDPNGGFGLWLTVSSAMPWRPWGRGEPRAGDLVYRGSADRLAGRWQGARCGLEPLAEAEVAPHSDGWVDFGPEPVRLTLYRVRECGDAPAEAPPAAP